jgi:hypothetical protein
LDFFDMIFKDRNRMRFVFEPVLKHTRQRLLSMAFKNSCSVGIMCVILSTNARRA